MQGFYVKALFNKIPKGLNIWEGIQCPWTKNAVLEMPILPPNALLTKIQPFWVDPDNLFLWQHRRPRIAKAGR